MTWLEPQNRTILNYQQADALWSRVRTPHKGKPITGWLRMFKNDEDFLFKVVSYGESDLCRLTPDNKLTFVMPPETLMGNAQTLVSALHRWLPFTTMRHRKGLYRIAGTQPVLDEMKKRHDRDGDNDPHHGHPYRMYQHYNPVMREKAYYFEGIQFDIVNGECLNPKADVKLVEKPEERKQWRRALAAFKRGIKARVRVHAFDGIIDEMWAERQAQSNRWHWQQPQWESKEWMDILESSIRDNKFPPELLKGLAQTSSTGYYMTNKPDSSDILKALDYVCNNQSIELRRRFGVFAEE